MPPAPLRIANGNWGGTGLLAIHAVLQSAYDVLTHAFGEHPDAPINVARWDRSPQVFYDRRPYEIRINAQDTYWCQYVYQFSHELCHILTNFDRHRTHAHKWFEESLCELAALFVLHGLTDTWTAGAPNEVFGARGYAQYFRDYAQDIVSGHHQPEGAALPGWLGQHRARLEADPCIRELNRVVAVALLKRFLEDPSLWRDCAELNGWDAGTNGSFRDYLAAWSDHVESLGDEAQVPGLVSRMFLNPAPQPSPSPKHPA